MNAGPSGATLFTSAPAPGVSVHRRRELGRDVLHADAEPRARDTCPVLRICVGHALRHVARDGEADALAAADDHRVDAEHVALQIAERPAGVARVDARVGLQVVLDRVHPEAAAALRREHAGGHRVAEAERRADGDDPLAHARRVGVGELRRREARRVDLDDGEVGRRVAPDEARRQVAPVAQAHVDGERLLDDVVVREDRAVGA